MASARLNMSFLGMSIKYEGNAFAAVEVCKTDWSLTLVTKNQFDEAALMVCKRCNGPIMQEYLQYAHHDDFPAGGLHGRRMILTAACIYMRNKTADGPWKPEDSQQWNVELKYAMDRAKEARL